LTASGPTISQISLSWINNSPDDTGIEIDRKVGSGAYTVVAVVSPSTTNYIDTGLTPGTPYTYRVRAVSNALASGFSPESSATTLPGTPSAPTSLTAAASASNWNQINLSWSGDGSNATNYEIYRRTGTSAYSLIGTVLPNVTTYSDNAANADTLYTYEVRAVNSNFASAYTNEASARTIQSPPTAPSSLTATAAAPNWTQINLKWTVTLSTATA